MIIENADRFGLAQLHQLRGRVGRGEAQSFCVLLTDSDSPETLARLNVLHTSNDGFYLAEQDLKLRARASFLACGSMACLICILLIYFKIQMF